jgi:hypothetical protein
MVLIPEDKIMQTQSNGFNIVFLAGIARNAVLEGTRDLCSRADRVAGWPTLVCKDGFSMSVQAGRAKFSTPAVEGVDHYSHVEVAHTDHCAALAPYGDEDEGIYQFVPVEVVEQLLVEHGGLDIPGTVEYRRRLLSMNRSTYLC